MDTESGTKGGKVVTLVRKQESSTCEMFLEHHLSVLRKVKPEDQPRNIMVIEYYETPEQSAYNLYFGGPNELRPHNMIGILTCLSVGIAGTGDHE